jgi:enoyl-[acyl-carrier protein] reductase II
MIQTALTHLLGIEHPVIQAGMGGVAGSRLAIAVSNAGGLGVLGAALLSPQAAREEIRRIKDGTDRPYGVDLLLADGTPEIPELMAVLFEERVPVFVSGLGDPGRWVEPMHEAGMKVVALVGNVRQAQRCARSGVDVIVAQGHEAGGHTGRVPTFVLVPLVVDAVAPIPVVAAGGVGDGRGLAAALMLGAQGVLVGTRFIATEEAACHDGYKNKLEEIDEEGTVVTRSYTGKPCRVVRNRHTEEWARREAEIQQFPLQLLAVGERARLAIAEGEVEHGLAPSGQIAGMIHDRPKAAQIVERLVEQAEALLRGAPGRAGARSAAVEPASGRAEIASSGGASRGESNGAAGTTP